MEVVEANQGDSCNIDNKGCCCTSQKPSLQTNLTSHWNNAYNSAELDKLGWYEEKPESSLNLLDQCNLNFNSSILNVGAGTTNFVEELLNRNYNNLIVNDISSVAINKLKSRIPEKHQNKIHWVEDDLIQPNELNRLVDIDLWHDRAVLHFFQKQEEQDTYFKLLKKIVKKDGHVIIAAFNLNGADKCSGLPIFKYNENMLEDKLGNDFTLIQAFDYTYIMPSGDPREYVYTLFKRVKKTNGFK